MDLPTAKRTASDLLDLGFNVFVSQSDADVWTIQVQAPQLLDKPTVDAFAAQHGVKASVYSVTTAVSLG